MYDRLLGEVLRMLCAGVVHGDLSDFNVLVGADGPVIIDFPQSVDTAHNANARKLLLRDVDNLHRFLRAVRPERASPARTPRRCGSSFSRTRSRPTRGSRVATVRPSGARTPTPCSISFRTRTTTSASGANRWAYAAVRAPTVLRRWLHDKLRLGRRGLKVGPVTIPSAPINLAVSQPAMGLRATTDRETGRRAMGRRRAISRAMGHSQAVPRSMVVLNTIALSSRTRRMRHPLGRAPEADARMRRRASVTRNNTSR